MQLRPGYESSRIIEVNASRQRERDLAVARGLKGDIVNTGLVSRIVGRLRGGDRPRPPIAEGLYMLTDTVCRLADGSAGRIAMREAEGEWVEVCVAA